MYDRRRTTTVLLTLPSPFPRLGQSPSAPLQKCTTQSISTLAVKSQSQCEKQGLHAPMKCQPIKTIAKDWSEKKWMACQRELVFENGWCDGDFLWHRCNEKLVIIFYFCVSHYTMLNSYGWTFLLYVAVFRWVLGLAHYFSQKLEIHHLLSGKKLDKHGTFFHRTDAPVYMYMDNMICVLAGEVCCPY